MPRVERRSTHEISTSEKGKLPMGSTTVSGLVELGSRPAPPVGGTVEDGSISPVAVAVVECSALGCNDTVHGTITPSNTGMAAKVGLVELGSHQVAPLENPRSRTAGVRTVGPTIGRERTDGLVRARISESRQPTRPSVRMAQEPRHRRVESWKVKDRLGDRWRDQIVRGFWSSKTCEDFE